MQLFISMDSTFNGITILSVSKQLNIEISDLCKDILFSLTQLMENDLFASIQSILHDTTKIDQQTLDANTNLNLSHLFALIITFGVNMELIHISKLLQKQDKYDEDIDINLVQFFEHQRRQSQQHIDDKLLHRVEKCKQNNAVLLYFDDTPLSNNDDRSDPVWKCDKKLQCMSNVRNELSPSGKSAFNALCQSLKRKNAEIWRQCTQCRSPAACKANAVSKPKINTRLRRHNNMKVLKIPKKILPKYHDKNYHVFGKQHNLPSYRMDEIVTHNTEQSCWIVVHGLVLDVTSFLPYHPASAQCIVKNGGKVCDFHYNMHSKTAQQIFWKFVIGKVQKENECLIQ